MQSMVLSDETVVSQHPWVDDPQAELERLEKQKQKEQEEFEKQYNPFGVKQNPNNSDDPPDDQGGDE